MNACILVYVHNTHTLIHSYTHIPIHSYTQLIVCKERSVLSETLKIFEISNKVCMYMYVRMYVCMNVCMYVMYVCMYMYVCVCIVRSTP